MPETTEENVKNFYLDSKSLSKIIEAVFVKVKGSIKEPLMVKDLDETELELLLLNINDNYSTDKDNSAVSIDLLSEIISALKLSSVRMVSGNAIDEAVEMPNSRNLYIFSTPEDPTNYGLYMYQNDAWVCILAPKSKNDLALIDTTKPDSVDNVVSHVNRKETNYSGSANAQPEDVISVQALTNILISLSYSKTVNIPYSADTAEKSISEVVTKPAVNTIYVYQESEVETDWSVWTVATTVVDGVTKYNWIQISGSDSSSSATEVNLTNYWSKDELVPITDEEITSIVDTAATNAGF